jgi:hypothetical protein
MDEMCIRLEPIGLMRLTQRCTGQDFDTIIASITWQDDGGQNNASHDYVRIVHAHRIVVAEGCGIARV